MSDLIFLQHLHTVLLLFGHKYCMYRSKTTYKIVLKHLKMQNLMSIFESLTKSLSLQHFLCNSIIAGYERVRKSVCGVWLC